MKPQLNNPAVIAAIAASPQGQRAIDNTIVRANNLSTNTVAIAKNVLWIGLFGYIGYKFYTRVFSTFKPISQDLKYRPAKINDATALAKAETIYKAMEGVGNGFNTVKANLEGTYHNDYIKIFNAFGKRQGFFWGSKNMNLTEWILDQFKGEELIYLRTVRPDFF